MRRHSRAGSGDRAHKGREDLGSRAKRGLWREEVMEAAQEGGCCQGPVNRVTAAERSRRMNSELTPVPDWERGHCEPWN